MEGADDAEVEVDEDDEPLDAAATRLYRGVAARLNYIAPDRPDVAYAVKESARSMQTPSKRDLKRLRKIAKYLIGCPRLVAKFKYQNMPTVITAFTDSDWAGCSMTSKSTSGGALCLGEHVIKTYCKQQKVIALSSAKAELYAMVAASAEALALQAYARDLSLEFACELYCDSAAALGIAQRAGIGKVRHLRTQGLWVQEVRSSGRIAYRKVLGDKNPADLMTKHMSSELANRHLTTLNMELTDGRADVAPTLDSIIYAWYTDDDGDIMGVFKGDKKVHFNPEVQVRPIPAIGQFRKTPPRNARHERGPDGHIHTLDDHIDIDEHGDPHDDRHDTTLGDQHGDENGGRHEVTGDGSQGGHGRGSASDQDLMERYRGLKCVCGNTGRWGDTDFDDCLKCKMELAMAVNNAPAIEVMKDLTQNSDGISRHGYHDRGHEDQEENDGKKQDLRMREASERSDGKARGEHAKPTRTRRSRKRSHKRGSNRREERTRSVLSFDSTLR